MNLPEITSIYLNLPEYSLVIHSVTDSFSDPFPPNLQDIIIIAQWEILYSVLCLILCSVHNTEYFIVCTAGSSL